MNDESRLPTTLEACHSLIRNLQSQLNEKTRLVKSLMGYDPTDPGVLALGRAVSRELSDEDKAAIEEELAAENAMRVANRRRRRKD